MAHLLGRDSARCGVASITAASGARGRCVRSLFSWRPRRLRWKFTQMVDGGADTKTAARLWKQLGCCSQLQSRFFPQLPATCVHSLLHLGLTRSHASENL